MNTRRQLSGRTIIAITILTFVLMYGAGMFVYQQAQDMRQVCFATTHDFINCYQQEANLSAVSGGLALTALASIPLGIIFYFVSRKRRQSLVPAAPPPTYSTDPLCPNCQHPNRVRARFCGNCGKALLSSSSAPPVSSSNYFPPQSYAPPITPPTSSRRWIWVALGLIVLLLDFGGYILYRVNAENEYAAGIAAQQGGDCDTANVHFQQVAEFYRFSGSAVINQVESANGDCLHLASGRLLRAQKNFLQALAQFDFAKQSSNSTILAQAQKEYDMTLAELAEDTGADGAFVMQQALHALTQGNRSPWPIVGTAKLTDAKMMSEQFDLGSLKAHKPSEFHYAVFYIERTREVERCPYYSSFGLTYPDGIMIREIITWDVTARDARTGQASFQKTFDGSPPRECGQTETFAQGTISKTERGSKPDAAAAIAWLQSQLDLALTPTPTPTHTATATFTPTVTFTSSPTATFTPTTTPTHVPDAIVKSDKLNIRRGPTQAFEILVTINKNETLSVLARLADGTWLEVQTVSGTRGWALASGIMLNVPLSQIPLATNLPPTPTPRVTATPRPTATPKVCPSNPAYVSISNELDSAITLILKGPQNYSIGVPASTRKNVCLVPGTYSWTRVRSGYENKTGTEAFSEREWSCWWWSYLVHVVGSCDAPTDPAAYQAP